MEHISAFIAIRRRDLEKRRQLSLFQAPRQKGSSEWSAFSSMQHDTVDAYPVRQPRVVHVPVHSVHAPGLRFTVPIIRYAH